MLEAPPACVLKWRPWENPWWVNNTGLRSSPSSHTPVTVSLGVVGDPYHSQSDSLSDECGQGWEQEENKAQRHQWEGQSQGV